LLAASVASGQVDLQATYTFLLLASRPLGSLLPQIVIECSLGSALSIGEEGAGSALFRCEQLKARLRLILEELLLR
jgi:hypothetical protein